MVPRKPKKRSQNNRITDLVEVSRFGAVRGNDLIKFVRTTQMPAISFVPATGFSGIAFDLEMAFSLQSTNIYLGGVLTSSVTNPGYLDITGLFQEWRIESVEIGLFYSNNCSQINNTQSLPIIQIAADYTSTAGTTASSLLQYENVRVIQLGNYKGEEAPIFRFKPRFNLQNSGGATVVSNVSAGWASSLQPTLPHAGLKIFYDNQLTTSATSVGTLSLYVRYHLAARKTN
jgi:hypothetical protein